MVPVTANSLFIFPLKVKKVSNQDGLISKILPESLYGQSSQVSHDLGHLCHTYPHVNSAEISSNFCNVCSSR